MSNRKLFADRRSRYSGPRRDIPKVRAQNAARKSLIGREHDLLEAIARDIDIRRAIWRGMHGTEVPYAVYTDFDHSYLLTETDPRHLPKWAQLGEYLKMQILFLVAMEEGGYSFTVNIRPDLQAKWITEGRDIMDRIRRLVDKALGALKISNLAFCYAVEGRTKRGSKAKLHLHGFLVSSDPMVATKFKVAMELALAAHPAGKAAAGIAAQSGAAVDIEPAYELNAGKKEGRGRWISYIAKNVMK